MAFLPTPKTDEEKNDERTSLDTLKNIEEKLDQLNFQLSLITNSNIEF